MRIVVEEDAGLEEVEVTFRAPRIDAEVIGAVSRLRLYDRKLTGFILFSVVGYAIIAAWVFASGWCPMEGLGLFTLICVIALVFAGVITFVVSAKEDRRLNEQLSAYKAK